VAQKLVQIQFGLTVSAGTYTQTVAPLVQAIADLAGLQWKIWLLNDITHAAGGIYLFADESSAQAFLTGPVIEQIGQLPGIRSLSTQQFDLIETLTEVTRGPLAAYARGL
jgi:hypothetical protein